MWVYHIRTRAIPERLTGVFTVHDEVLYKYTFTLLLPIPSAAGQPTRLTQPQAIIRCVLPRFGGAIS